MNTERNYLLEFIMLWFKAAVFYLIGGYIGSVVNDGVFLKEFGFSLAITVFGMTFFNKVIRFNLFGNSDSVKWFWLLKFVFSFVIGFFAFPIVNLYYIVMIIKSVICFLTRNRMKG